MLDLRVDTAFSGHRQSLELSLPGDEYLLSGHTKLRFWPPPGQKWSSLQNWHSTGNGVHSEVVSPKYPGRHRHCPMSLASGDAASECGGQGLDAPCTHQSVTLHPVQLPPFAPAYPASHTHAVGWVDATGLEACAGHARHAEAFEAPSALEYVPAPHDAHTDGVAAPAAVEYVPCPQNRQADTELAPTVTE